MRIVEPPLDSPRREAPGDDLDGLLSAFFRSQMPAPWPGLEGADEQPKPTLPAGRAPRRPALRSRFALAASVALLLAGGWLLSDKFEAVAGPGAFPGTRPSADLGADRPGGALREDGARPRIRERMILDRSGQTRFQVEVDLP